MPLLHDFLFQVFLPSLLSDIAHRFVVSVEAVYFASWVNYVAVTEIVVFVSAMLMLPCTLDSFLTI